MLLACLYIAERGIENVALLSAQRSQWADPYFPNLKIRITKAFDENVGVDILHQLKRQPLPLPAPYSRPIARS